MELGNELDFNVPPRNTHSSAAQSHFLKIIFSVKYLLENYKPVTYKITFKVKQVYSSFAQMYT